MEYCLSNKSRGQLYLYPELLRVTCVSYALYRICEIMRVLYPNVDKLVAYGKKIFVKSPARIELFKTKL
jgi:hypothetical protein